MIQPSPSPVGAYPPQGAAWIRFPAALAEFSMTKHQLRPLLLSGDVTGKKIGRVWLISRESLEGYLYADQRRARLAVRSVLG
jgi:hypothetical protein